MEVKEDDEKSSKKQDVLLIKYKKDGDEFQIYIQFDKTETLVKLNKKLGKNIKKVKSEIETQNAVKTLTRKEEEKKVNP